MAVTVLVLTVTEVKPFSGYYACCRECLRKLADGRYLQQSNSLRIAREYVAGPLLYIHVGNTIDTCSRVEGLYYLW